MNRSKPRSPQGQAWPRAYDPWIVEAVANGPQNTLWITGYLASRLKLSLWDSRLPEITGRIIRHAIRSHRVCVIDVQIIGGQRVDVLDKGHPQKRR